MGNTTTADSSALSKVYDDVNGLKSLIDNKSSYTQVATFVYDTIYPDLNTAFGLGLERVDVAEAIEEARIGYGRGRIVLPHNFSLFLYSTRSLSFRRANISNLW